MKNNQGFTLLEALMGMFVMGVLVLLMLQMVLLLNKTTTDFFDQRQTIMFVMNAQNDLMGAKTISIENDCATIKQFDQQEIEYCQVNNNLVRKVNNQGNEILLYNLDTIEFLINEGVLSAKIYYQDQETMFDVTLGKAKF